MESEEELFLDSATDQDQKEYAKYAVEYMKANIPGRWKEERLRHDLKQNEIANKLDLAPSVICAIEKGERIPTLIQVVRYCAYLDADPAWLLGLSDYTCYESDKEIFDVTERFERDLYIKEFVDWFKLLRTDELAFLYNLLLASPARCALLRLHELEKKHWKKPKK